MMRCSDLNAPMGHNRQIGTGAAANAADRCCGAPVNIIGAGLAGCEAAYQLSKRGVPVRLFDMKPEQMSPAHSYGGLAELVCSNSLRAAGLENAAGLLKEEMRRLDGLIMRAADATAVPAGGALAVDRQAFSDYITAEIGSKDNIELVSREVENIDDMAGITIIATGPLTQGPLAGAIERLTGSMPHFFDAAAPIVTAESIDMNKAFFASRYGKGDGDYLNCPMTEEEYRAFYEQLIAAEEVQLKGFEDASVFEGCMPVEVMARRGYQTLTFGPMKPVGLTDPRTGRQPYAVVQLRREDREGTLYNLVGFQTHLKQGEQRRVFGMIPGMENAEYVRYGAMHRNTYIDAPGVLDCHYRLIRDTSIYFAGQISGVEGYIESASSGLLCGIFAACQWRGLPLPEVSPRTACGALAHYVSTSVSADFQPMNINFGIMEPLRERIRKKSEKKLAMSARALSEIEELAAY